MAIVQGRREEVTGPGDSASGAWEKRPGRSKTQHRDAPLGHAFHTSSFVRPTVVSGSNVIDRRLPDTSKKVSATCGVCGTSSSPVGTAAAASSSSSSMSSSSSSTSSGASTIEPCAVASPTRVNDVRAEGESIVNSPATRRCACAGACGSVRAGTCAGGSEAAGAEAGAVREFVVALAAGAGCCPGMAMTEGSDGCEGVEGSTGGSVAVDMVRAQHRGSWRGWRGGERSKERVSRKVA